MASERRERFVKTIRKGGTSLVINIPSEIVHLLRLVEGDIVDVEISRRRKEK